MRASPAGAVLWGALLVVVSCSTFDGLVATLDENGALLDAGAGAPGASGASGASGKGSDGPDASFDADADAAPDAPPSAAPGFLSFDDALRLCRKIAACPRLGLSALISTAIPLDVSRFSSCVSWAAGPLPADHPNIAAQGAALSCIAQASSCEDAAECIWYEAVNAGDPRCKGIDTVAGVCADKGRTVNICPAAIQHCNGDFWGAGSTCIFDPSQGYAYCARTEGCPAARCDGDLYTSACAGPMQPYQTVNCALIGTTCGLDSLGIHGCLANGTVKKCASLDPVVQCAGNVVEVCTGYQGAEFNCASLGGTCSNAKGVVRCALPGDTCTAADPGIDACSGSVLSLCFAGQPMTFDCSKVGMTCKPPANGLSGRCD
jgi:hypothetical protein